MADTPDIIDFVSSRRTRDPVIESVLPNTEVGDFVSVKDQKRAKVEAAAKQKQDELFKPAMETGDYQKMKTMLTNAGANFAFTLPNIYSGLTQLPSTIFSGISSLQENAGKPERAQASRDISQYLYDNPLAKMVRSARPYITSEGVLKNLRDKEIIAPDFEPESVPGRVGKRILEKGPEYAATAGMAGLPATPNIVMSSITPGTGEFAANAFADKQGKKSEGARALAELGTAAILPPLQAAASHVIKQRRLSSDMPLSELRPTDPTFTKAAPYVAEEFNKVFPSATTKNTIIEAVSNPQEGNVALRQAQPALYGRVNQVRANVQNQADSRIANVQQMSAADQATAHSEQLSRELVARQAEADAAAGLTSLQGTRTPEAVGKALHGEITGAEEGMKLAVAPGYGSGWERSKIPQAQVAEVVDSLSGVLNEARMVKDLGITPRAFLQKQFGKLWGETPNGVPYIAPQSAGTLVQIRREIDDMIDKYGTQFGSTPASMRRAAMSPVREQVNAALDASTDPKILAMRKADDLFAKFQAPLLEGETGKLIKPGDTLGFAKTPATTAEALVLPGTQGQKGAAELAKIAAAQQAAGVQSNIVPLVQEHLQNVIKTVATEAKGDTAKALEHLVNQYGTFMREFDSQFGTTLMSDAQTVLREQALKQERAAIATGKATAGAEQTLGQVMTARNAQEQAVTEAQSIADARRSAAASGTTAKFAGVDDPVEHIRGVIKDPQRSTELTALVNSAQKTGTTAQMYQGIVGAFRADIRDMLGGRGGFGAVQNAEATMQRYEAALQRAGAPQELINNLRTAYRDIEHFRNTKGAIGNVTDADVARADQHIAMAAMGRTGLTVMDALHGMLGSGNVGARISEMVLTDPEVARHILNYTGKNPMHLKDYLLSNAKIAAAMGAEKNK